MDACCCVGMLVLSTAAELARVMCSNLNCPFLTGHIGLKSSDCLACCCSVPTAYWRGTASRPVSLAVGCAQHCLWFGTLDSGQVPNRRTSERRRLDMDVDLPRSRCIYVQQLLRVMTGVFVVQHYISTRCTVQVWFSSAARYAEFIQQVSETLHLDIFA